MALVIRKGEPKDIELIYNFICELADYEKLSHDVTATPQILYDSLFVRNAAEVLIAYENDVPVGFALYFYNFSTFKGRECLYLEDIYISPEYRGRGYGKELFYRMAAVALENSCERFDWAVLDWNSSAIDFYNSLGAKPMSDWIVYRLTGDALKNLSKKDAVKSK